MSIIERLTGQKVIHIEASRDPNLILVIAPDVREESGEQVFAFDRQEFMVQVCREFDLVPAWEVDAAKVAASFNPDAELADLLGES